jgi:hypothetical protein
MGCLRLIEILDLIQRVDSRVLNRNGEMRRVKGQVQHVIVSESICGMYHRTLCMSAELRQKKIIYQEESQSPHYTR